MKIEIPTNCPSCQSDLELVNDQLFCRSKSCPAQITQKLIAFCKKLRIKGFGEKTLDKLGFESLHDLFSYDELVGTDLGLGIKTSQNLANEVQKAKVQEFAALLAAFSVPLIGDSASRKLATLINHPSEITVKVCKDAGLGDKATANLISWLETEWFGDLETLPISIAVKQGVPIPSGLEHIADVCITGKLNDFSSRTKAADYLEGLGFTVKKSVTKTVKYLIVEDGKTTSSSYKKAEAAGIDILTIQELVALHFPA